MTLRNTYYFMRHGQSEANIKKIIATKPEDNLGQNGLTTEGRKQVEASAMQLKEVLDELVIYSSDFLQTIETAAIVSKIFNTEIIVTKKIRERDFGDFDGMSTKPNYQKVWDHDESDGPDSTYANSESVNSIIRRVGSLINEAEGAHNNKNILFVSHGDTIILYKAHFYGEMPLHHMKNAEIRKLN